MTDHELASVLSQRALDQFCELQLHQAAWQRHGVTGKSVLRFSAAALAALENGLCFMAKHNLGRENVAGLFEALKLRFATHVQAISAAPILGLGDLIPSRAEQEAACLGLNMITGRTTSLDALLTARSDFASWFVAIQPVRFSGFHVFLVSSKNVITTALRQAFCFWYFGRQVQSEAEAALVEEVASTAHSVAKIVTDAVIPNSHDGIVQTIRFSSSDGLHMDSSGAQKIAELLSESYSQSNGSVRYRVNAMLEPDVAAFVRAWFPSKPFLTSWTNWIGQTLPADRKLLEMLAIRVFITPLEPREYRNHYWDGEGFFRPIINESCIPAFSGDARLGVIALLVSENVFAKLAPHLERPKSTFRP